MHQDNIDKYQKFAQEECDKICKLIRQLPRSINTDLTDSLQRLQTFSRTFAREAKFLKLYCETMQLVGYLQDLIEAINNFCPESKKPAERKSVKMLTSADPGMSAYQRVVELLSTQTIQLRAAIINRDYNSIKAILLPLYALMRENAGLSIKNSAMLKTAENILNQQIDGLCKLIPVLKAVVKIEDLRDRIGKKNILSFFPDDLQLKIFSYNSLNTVFALMHTDKNLNQLLYQRAAPLWTWLTTLYSHLPLLKDEVDYELFKEIYGYNRLQVYLNLFEDTVSGILLAKITESGSWPKYLSKWHKINDEKKVEYHTYHILEYSRQLFYRTNQKRYKQILDFFFELHQAQIASDIKLMDMPRPAAQPVPTVRSLEVRKGELFKIKNISRDKFTYHLTAASLCSQVDYVENLFKQGLSPQALIVNAENNSLMDWACANSCLPMVSFLLQAGAVVSPLAFYSAVTHLDPVMLECLLQKRESACFANDSVPVRCSRLYPDLSSARPYLYYIVARCGYGQDPRINLRLAELLIEAKADPQIVGENKDTLLHHTPHPAMAALLVNTYKIPVNLVDSQGFTPLGNLVRYFLTGPRKYPAEALHISQTMQFLINQGSDVYAQYGTTGKSILQIVADKPMFTQYGFFHKALSTPGGVKSAIRHCERKPSNPV